ncbi:MULTISPECIES: cation:proton antiporter [Alphaproteobacteria]|uniref:Cation:proton antiporter n=2 Tax=Alphaproteobacteria TaxID=28211 RepID=A0A512HFU5_9HYPH|nr:MULTISPECIES: cation:proton antiporter [Alphaproteobacteria]GEO84325.1 cation:proton antiporter [Ciceribacter naphthalenivorans]GLR24862.1 cation:proton antiporter [Ciceribacter naphthalenivorans]GLT07718.1 cation:proton antiporter [Sphingomonas psychrolutea]
MISPESIIATVCNFALVVLSLSFFLTVYRVVKGPTLPDRVLALDMLVGIAIGFIAVIAIRTGYTLYIDIAISLGLVGFLATVAFARFILARGVVGERPLEDAPVLRPQVAKAKGGKKIKPVASTAATPAPAKPRGGKKASAPAKTGGKK